MTDIRPTHPPHRGVAPPPFTLRIAALLCCAIGFYSLLPSVILGVQSFRAHDAPWQSVLAAPVSALLIGAAGVLLWLRRRLGVVLLAIGGVLPAVVNVSLGFPVHGPSVLLVIAAVLILFNLRQLGPRPFA